jgi:PAS domain S-box-containing protein
MASAEHGSAQTGRAEDIRLLVDTIPVSVWLTRPDGSAEFFNQRWLEYTGLPREQALDWGWKVAIHPEDLPRMLETFQEALNLRRSFEVEGRFRRWDGEFRWFLFRGTPLLDGSGDVVKWYGTNTDLEDRKRVEEKLQRSEADLLEAQRISQTGSWKLDVSSGTVTGSPQMLRIYGVKPDEDTSNFELWFGRTHPEDRKRMLDLFERSKIQKTDYDADYRIVLPDGAVKHIHTNGHPVLNDSGDVVEFVGTNMEITDRKRAEEALWRSEGYLADAQRLAHIGVWARNVGSSNSVYRSQEIYRLFGFDLESGLPSDEAFYRRIHPEDRDRVSIKAFHERTPKGADFDLEFRVVLPDGVVKYIRSAGRPVRNMSGEVTEYVGISMDVTERKRAEDELRASEYRHRHIFQANYVSIWEEDWSLVKAAIDDLKAQGIRDLRQYVEAHPEFVRQAIAMVRVLDVNEATVRLFGAQRKEQLLSSFDRMFASQAEDVFAEELVAIADGQTSFEAETVLRTLQGDEIAVLFTITFPQPTTLETVLVSIIDITQRKQAEEKIREQEVELRQILDAAPQFLFVLGSDGSRLYANQSVLDFRGLTVEEWQKLDFRERFHPDDAERMARQREQALSSGSPLETEARMPRHDGKYRWFLFRYKPLKDQLGRITRWVVPAIDIDDRKRSEERLQRENVALREEIDKASMFERIIGTSPALQTVLSRVSKVAATDSSVLITGETGTGKELVARAIHRRSKRSSGPFISMNCAAIPRDLIPSELFGHEKGAFTGATQQRLGRFELADGGTIFLDEVGEIPAETQIALLRVLQENEFERVGGVRSIRTDVRVVAATNRDLQTAIAAGTFRSDLFYRLNVFPIEVPPLRERREDIPLLVEYFIDRYARKAGKSFRAVNRKTLDLLQAYSWAGNIRELQNVIERSVIVCDTEEFSVDESWLSRSPLGTETKSQMDLSRRLATQEKEMIEAALRESGGRVSGRSGAAAKLGIPGPTLESKIRSLKIDKYRFKSAVSSPGRIK